MACCSTRASRRRGAGRRTGGYRGQLVTARIDGRMHTGDELDLRFAEVGGDVRMGQRGAERARMGRRCQHAVRPYPQTLLFDAPQEPLKHGRRKCTQGLLLVIQAASPDPRRRGVYATLSWERAGPCVNPLSSDRRKAHSAPAQRRAVVSSRNENGDESIDDASDRSGRRRTDSVLAEHPAPARRDDAGGTDVVPDRLCGPERIPKQRRAARLHDPVLQSPGGVAVAALRTCRPARSVFRRRRRRRRRPRAGIPRRARHGFQPEVERPGATAQPAHEFRYSNGSIAQAKANARAHYGLGKSFIEPWLDRDRHALHVRVLEARARGRSRRRSATRWITSAARCG